MLLTIVVVLVTLIVPPIAAFVAMGANDESGRNPKAFRVVMGVCVIAFILMVYRAIFHWFPGLTAIYGATGFFVLFFSFLAGANEESAE